MKDTTKRTWRSKLSENNFADLKRRQGNKKGQRALKE